MGKHRFRRFFGDDDDLELPGLNSAANFKVTAAADVEPSPNPTLPAGLVADPGEDLNLAAAAA